MRTIDLIDEFIYDCEIRKLTKWTIKSYRNHLRYFNRYTESIGITRFEDIDTVVIKKYISMHNRNKRKVTYVNGIIKVLKAFYKWTIIEEYMDEYDNPMNKVRYIKGEQPIITTFSKDEVKRMLEVYTGREYLQIRNQAILAMLFDTGIRNYELCSLSADAVKDNFILIWGKGNKERVVPKSSYLAKILQRYERVRDSYYCNRTYDENYYFHSRTGLQLTTVAIDRIVKIAGREAGVNEYIRCSPHTCRHFFAQSQLKSGNDIYTISRLLGHSNISITKTYIQSMKDDDVINKSMEFSPLMNLNTKRK